jgi:hypothetical protein
MTYDSGMTMCGVPVLYDDDRDAIVPRMESKRSYIPAKERGRPAVQGTETDPFLVNFTPPITESEVDTMLETYEPRIL